MRCGLVCGHEQTSQYPGTYRASPPLFHRRRGVGTWADRRGLGGPIELTRTGGWVQGTFPPSLYHPTETMSAMMTVAPAAAMAAKAAAPKGNKALRAMPAQQLRGAGGAACLATRRARTVVSAVRVVTVKAEDEVEMLEKALEAAKVSISRRLPFNCCTLTQRYQHSPLPLLAAMPNCFPLSHCEFCE